MSLEDRRQRYARAIKVSQERVASIGERLAQQKAVKVAMEKYADLAYEITRHLYVLRTDAIRLSQLQRDAPETEPPIQDLRGWIRYSAISELSYHEIKESIKRRYQGNAELQQYEDMLTEARLYCLHHPQPTLMMTKDELSEWIYNAFVVGSTFNDVERKVNYLHKSADEMNDGVNNIIKNLTAEYSDATKAADYYDHYYNPQDVDGFSRWTCTTIFNRERNVPSSKYIHHDVYLHHVRVTRGTTKVFLHIPIQDRYPSLVGWFALCDPSQTDELMRSICMPKHSALANARWVHPPRTTRMGDIDERDNTLDGSQVQIEFTVERDTIAFLFEGCTLDKTGPLPECLRRFIPQNVRVNQSNPYVFEAPLTRHDAYLHMNEMYRLYANCPLHENSDGVYDFSRTITVGPIASSASTRAIYSSD